MNFAYYTNQLLDGARRMMTKNYRTMRKHFKAAAEEEMDIVRKVPHGVDRVDARLLAGDVGAF